MLQPAMIVSPCNRTSVTASAKIVAGHSVSTQLDKIKNLHSQIRSGPVVGFSSHTVSDEGLPRAGLGGH